RPGCQPETLLHHRLIQLRSTIQAQNRNLCFNFYRLDTSEIKSTSTMSYYPGQGYGGSQQHSGSYGPPQPSYSPQPQYGQQYQQGGYPPQQTYGSGGYPPQQQPAYGG